MLVVQESGWLLAFAVIRTPHNKPNRIRRIRLLFPVRGTIADIRTPHIGGTARRLSALYWKPQASSRMAWSRVRQRPGSALWLRSDRRCAAESDPGEFVVLLCVLWTASIRKSSQQPLRQLLPAIASIR
jgi:hypothetical protein